MPGRLVRFGTTCAQTTSVDGNPVEMGAPHYLQRAAAEDALVENKRLGDQVRFGEFDVGVAEVDYRQSAPAKRTHLPAQPAIATPYPLGWPVNLSNRIVTRLIEPQLWKCAWISSGLAS